MERVSRWRWLTSFLHAFSILGVSHQGRTTARLRSFSLLLNSCTTSARLHDRQRPFTAGCAVEYARAQAMQSGVTCPTPG
jgi:hypothetical protein